MEDHMYLCIDLKSFYASVECVERGLDPMKTNLAVADPDRGSTTVCLAITPAMKALGIKNRCRVYEIPRNIPYIMAPPRMNLYMKYSADIYAIYLKYIAKEDIHVYSIDEAFLDVTHYLSLYQMSAKQLAATITEDILKTTKITATAGVGTNLYLAKVALDILAKHAKNHIGYLDETLYQKTMWSHKPLTDFWRIGAATQKRLHSIGIMTMGDLAHADAEMLFHMFGVDAELLIDHAWGRESATIADIKAYSPKTNSLSSGQVLPRNYSFEECRLIVKEMLNQLCLDMAEDSLAAQSISLVIGYSYELEAKPASGTISMKTPTNSYAAIVPDLLKLYEHIAQKNQPIRRVQLTCNKVIPEIYEQYQLFTDYEAQQKEKNLQKAVLEIRHRFGKNAILRGMDLQEAGTAIERNKQIGGHKSGV